MAGILDGVRVIELAEGWVGAAMCGRMLCDLGGDVVKVEAPAGDPLRRRPPFVGDLSIPFNFIAAGKSSVVLDPVARRADRDRLLALIDGTDILIEGWGPDVSWGPALDHVELARRNPRLIHASLSTFGRTGADAGRTGSELVAQAASGLMSSTGEADAPPTRVGFAAGEQSAAIFACVGIAAALVHRMSVGRGQFIDIAAQDCLFSYHSSYLPKVFVEGAAPPRMGFRHPMISPWDLYRARDGGVIVCTGNDAHWTAILGVVERRDLLADDAFATPSARVRNADRVAAIIEGWTLTRSVDEVVAALGAIGIPAGPSLALDQVLAHPQLAARGLLTRSTDDSGAHAPVSGSIFRMSRTPGRCDRSAPPLGAHSARASANAVVEA